MLQIRNNTMSAAVCPAICFDATGATEKISCTFTSTAGLAVVTVTFDVGLGVNAVAGAARHVVSGDDAVVALDAAALQRLVLGRRRF